MLTSAKSLAGVNELEQKKKETAKLKARRKQELEEKRKQREELRKKKSEGKAAKAQGRATRQKNTSAKHSRPPVATKQNTQKND